jgi:hypothetical protein
MDFAKQGYTKLPGYFSTRDGFNAAIERIVRERAEERIFMRYSEWRSLAELDLTYEDFFGKSHMLRVPEIHSMSPDLMALIDSCGFEEALSDLLPGKPRMSFLQSLYFPFSSKQGAHSDKFLVSPPGKPYVRETLCGVWLALDSSGPDNGALFGFSGSHLVPDKPLLQQAESYGAYCDSLTTLLRSNGLDQHLIEAVPGDVIVWASDFVHGGSNPLKPDIPRRSLVLHYGSTVDG